MRLSNLEQSQATNCDEKLLLTITIDGLVAYVAGGGNGGYSDGADYDGVDIGNGADDTGNLNDVGDNALEDNVGVADVVDVVGVVDGVDDNVDDDVDDDNDEKSVVDYGNMDEVEYAVHGADSDLVQNYLSDWQTSLSFWCTITCLANHHKTNNAYAAPLRCR